MVRDDGMTEFIVGLVIFPILSQTEVEAATAADNPPDIVIDPLLPEQVIG